MNQSTFLAAFALFCFANAAAARDPVETFSIWPDKPPGPPRERGPEKIVEGRPRPFYQITDVSTPTVAVFLPPVEKRSGAGMLVCPGGGLQRLAIEHEGFETAEWLASQGIAAFVLKYRVPDRAQIGLQDAQRALSVIRARSGEWGVDPEDIGVAGFSAGAEIAAWLATHHQERQYEAIDSHDSLSIRPAFATLVYPGGLTARGQLQVKEPIAGKINSETPPMFIIHAFDDSSENSIAMMAALKKAGVRSELHLYQDGAHGFGLRAMGAPIDAWKESWLRWMKSQGFLDSAPVRAYARARAAAGPFPTDWPKIQSQHPNATIDDAYAAQRRLVRAALAKGDRIAGFKIFGVDPEQRKYLGQEELAFSVLLNSMKLNSTNNPVVDLPPGTEAGISGWFGFIASVDIGYEILNDAQARGAVTGIVPVVEIAEGRGFTIHIPKTAVDNVAANRCVGKFLVGPLSPPTALEGEGVRLRVKMPSGDGSSELIGKPHHRDCWQTVREAVNLIVSQGYTIHAGDLILFCGPSAATPAARKTVMDVNFDPLGTVKFQIQ